MPIGSLQGDLLDVDGTDDDNIRRRRSKLCAPQAGCGAVGRPSARGKDALVAPRGPGLAALQRQALRSVGGFGAEFLGRGFAAHQSTAGSAYSACRRTISAELTGLARPAA
jgi:hypothetical protein